MVKGDFRGFERAKAIGSSGDHVELIVHPFDATCRNLTSRDKLERTARVHHRSRNLPAQAGEMEVQNP